MTDRLSVRWPDPIPFVARDGRPIRILALSDEPDPSLDSAATREGLGRIDLIVGAGDLDPSYLGFVTDAFHAPLRYVRGNHDVGAAWVSSERNQLPEPLPDGTVISESGLRIIGFSGSPRYNERNLQVSSLSMWIKVIRAWPGASGVRPLIVVTHAPPRDVNDDHDHAHRGFSAFRWFADRIDPPLWLHGHTALVRRGIDDRIATHGGTTFYNCTGSTLVKLLPPDSPAEAHVE